MVKDELVKSLDRIVEGRKAYFKKKKLSPKGEE
jgi:hypothetical protein